MWFLFIFSFITQVIKIYITWTKKIYIYGTHTYSKYGPWNNKGMVLLGYFIILNICTFHFSLYCSWVSQLQAYRISFPHISSVSCNSPSPIWFLNSTGNLEQPAYSCCVCRSGILALESCNLGNLCFLPYVFTAIRQPLKAFLEISQNTSFFILCLVWRDSS